MLTHLPDGTGKTNIEKIYIRDGAYYVQTTAGNVYEVSSDLYYTLITDILSDSTFCFLPSGLNKLALAKYYKRDDQWYATSVNGNIYKITETEANILSISQIGGSGSSIGGQPTTLTSTDPRTVITGSGTYNVTIDTTGISSSSSGGNANISGVYNSGPDITITNGDTISSEFAASPIQINDNYYFNVDTTLYVSPDLAHITLASKDYVDAMISSISPSSSGGNVNISVEGTQYNMTANLYDINTSSHFLVTCDGDAHTYLNQIQNSQGITYQWLGVDNVWVNNAINTAISNISVSGTPTTITGDSSITVSQDGFNATVSLNSSLYGIGRVYGPGGSRYILMQSDLMKLDCGSSEIGLLGDQIMIQQNTTDGIDRTIYLSSSMVSMTYGGNTLKATSSGCYANDVLIDSPCSLSYDSSVWTLTLNTPNSSYSTTILAGIPFNFDSTNDIYQFARGTSFAVDFNGCYVTNDKTSFLGTELVNKNYVDNAISSISPGSVSYSHCITIDDPNGLVALTIQNSISSTATKLNLFNFLYNNNFNSPIRVFPASGYVNDDDGNAHAIAGLFISSSYICAAYGANSYYSLDADNLTDIVISIGSSW